MDGGLCALIREAIEVELPLRGRDIAGYGLLALDRAIAGLGIEGARASGIVELHLLDIGRDALVCEHEATERSDTIQGDRQIDIIIADSDLAIIGEGITEALGIGELDLRRVGHRGVAIGAMTHDEYLIGAFFQAEGGLAEISIGGDLIDLLDARASGIIDGEIHARAGLRGRFGRARDGEGHLLYLKDTDREIGVFVSGRTADHTAGVNDGLLAGEEKRGKCA